MKVTDALIIYQDHHLLVINKPAGVVIHPTYKHSGDTLWDALLPYLEQQGEDGWRPPELPDEPEWKYAPSHIQDMLRRQRTERLWKEEGLLPRPCLLHRLDKDTSGVVALARTERARRYLARQFQDHVVEKRYFAVVQKGAPDWARPRTLLRVSRVGSDGNRTAFAPDELFSLSPDARVRLEGPLWRDPDDRRRCIVVAGGQDASTDLRVLLVTNDKALLEVCPVTGRTHQIRAHLAALGYAIVGDQVYASQDLLSKTSLPRQFLHAYALTLCCYPTYASCCFVAPLADDLCVWAKCNCPKIEAQIHEQLQAIDV